MTFISESNLLADYKWSTNQEHYVDDIKILFNSIQA